MKLNPPYECNQVLVFNHFYVWLLVKTTWLLVKTNKSQLTLDPHNIFLLMYKPLNGCTLTPKFLYTLIPLRRVSVLCRAVEVGFYDTTAAC